VRTKHILMGTVLLGGLACAQTTLISSSPGGSGLCVSSVPSAFSSPTIAYFSWTTTTAYANVAIAANLFGLGPTTGQVTGYLSNSVGPGATAIATSAPVSVVPTAQANLTLFSGLTLPAGTYYLVLTSNLACGNGDLGWSYTAATPTVVPGVILGTEGYASPSIGSTNTSNPVASTFVTSGTLSLSVQVTASSTPAPPIGTPIPPSLMLSVTGLAGLGIYQLLRRRRWWTA
jgi:hypothetical protein